MMAISQSAETQAPSIAFSHQEATRAQASLFRALADATRLHILELLRNQSGQLSVSELVGHFHLAQSTISHHLHLLREAKLVDFRKHGLHTYYFVCPDTLAQAQRHLDALSPPSLPA